MLLTGIQPRQVSQNQVLQFQGFPYGLRTSVPVFQLDSREASALVNFTIKKGGKLVTRDPISKYTTTATTSSSAVKRIAGVTIGATNYTILQDAAFKVYYLDSDPKPVYIADLAAQAQILAYNGVCLLLDGDCLKYMDDVSSIKIAYDDGTGSSGYQFDNRSGTSGGTIALGNGTNTRIATKFTSQAWTAGYTIPPTTMSAYLKKTGSPTGSIVMKVRKVSDDSVLATKTFLSDVSTLDGSTAALYTATFAAGDITNEMSPSTAYYATLEYSAGDAANYVDVSYETVASGGTCYHYAGSWANDATYDPLMALKPGRPPKGSFGAVADGRLAMAGDPDNPGYVWFSNLTHLDWSTSGGGGYIGAVDDNKNNYEVGGINSLYGDLLVYGTQAQPYLAKLTGSSPSDYALPLSFQKVWTTPRTLVSAVNDMWAGSGEGVDPVSGVQEYGDLRTFSVSDPIDDRLNDYWSSTTAFASYYPKEGQYWLIMPLYHRVMVCHTKLPTRDPSGQGLRYPWCEYEFYRDIFTSSSYKWMANGDEYYLVSASDTMKDSNGDEILDENGDPILTGSGDPSISTQPDFITMDGTVLTEGTAGSLTDHEWGYALDPTGTYYTIYLKDATGNPTTSGVDIRSILLPTEAASVGSLFLLGGSDGFIYKLDSSKYRDLGAHQIHPKIGSAYIEMPFGHSNFEQYQLLASSISGGQVGIDFYVDGKRVTASDTVSMGVSDGLTVDQAIMDVDDAYFSVDIEQTQLFDYINFNGRSIMFTMKDIELSGYPIYITGLMIKYRGLSY